MGITFSLRSLCKRTWENDKLVCSVNDTDRSDYLDKIIYFI